MRLIYYLLKFTILRATSSTKVQPLLKLLNEVASYFGVPFKIVTDRGSAFTSQSFMEFMKKHDIKHTKVAVKSPQANGKAERVYNTIIPAIKSMCENFKKCWDKNLPSIQWTLNNSAKSTIRKGPHELLLNFTPRDVIGNQLILAIHDMKDELSCDVESF